MIIEEPFRRVRMREELMESERRAEIAAAGADDDAEDGDQ